MEFTVMISSTQTLHSFNSYVATREDQDFKICCGNTSIDGFKYNDAYYEIHLGTQI